MFEPKNIERQNFSTIGTKAHVVADDIKAQTRNIFIVPRAAWVVSDEVAAQSGTDDDDNTIGKIGVSDLLQEGDYVFCVVDNYATRKLVFDAAQKYNNIDIYTGGNDERLFGSVYHYRRREGQDVSLHPATMHDEFRNPQDRNPGEMSCQERAELDGGTQLLAINMAVAAYLLGKAAHTIFPTTSEEEQAAMEIAEVYLDLELGLSQPYDRRPALVPVNS